MNLSTLRRQIKFSHPLIYRLVSRVRPQRVQIQTTSICNANCDFCPYPEVAKEVPMGNMSDELFEKVVKDGLAFGIKNYALYLLNEPFVDPKIVDRISFVTKLGGKVELSSNGSLLSEKKGRAAFEAGLKYLVINMPSVVKEEYQRIVSKLNFDTVMANLESLSHYHHDYQAQVQIQINIRPGRDDETVKKAVAHWRERGLNVLTRRAMDWAGNLSTFSQDIYIHNLGGCSDFRELTDIYILFNGDVILCCEDWRRTTHLGNAKEKDLEEIYFDRPYFEIRKKIQGLSQAQENFICRRCEFAIPRR